MRNFCSRAIGRIKLMVDAGRTWKTGISGGGGVICTEDDVVIAGFYVHYGQMNISDAELLTMKHGLELVKALKYKNVFVQSDDQGSVDLVNNGKPTSDPVVNGIRSLLIEIESRMDWLGKENNTKAHRLAKKGKESPEHTEPYVFGIDGEIPKEVVEIWEKKHV